MLCVYTIIIYILECFCVNMCIYRMYHIHVVLNVFLFVHVFTHFDLKADTYKRGIENERSDHEKMAYEIEKDTTKTVKQENPFCGEEKMKQKTVPFSEACTAAVLKISHYEKEVLALKQTLQTKEETWKRSLEEARASSSKLNEEVMLLTQQVKQYKKLADKHEQVNISQVQQIYVLCMCYRWVRGRERGKREGEGRGGREKEVKWEKGVVILKCNTFKLMRV